MHVGWMLIIAGALLYVYEGQTGNYLFPSIENLIPGNTGLDLPLILVGAFMLHKG
jgi:hypothetical protein